MTQFATREDARRAIIMFANALYETVLEVGDTGAPGGLLYAGVMGHMALDQFQAIMGALVEAGKLTKRGDCYYPA